MASLPRQRQACLTRQARGRKLAEESQLLAEERYIIEAIKKIRTQRNCLQIERLQLESMLAEQKHGPLKKTLQTQQIVENNTKEPGAPSVLPMSEKFEFVDIEAFKPGSMRVMNEDLCNFEELNLTVSEPMLAHASTSRYPEEEEEEEDDYSDCDENMIIDMNMFMTN